MSGPGAFAEIGEIAPQQLWAGVVGRVVHGERVTLAFVELDANSVVPNHSHGNEQVGLLLRGSLLFTVGEETRELRPGSTWRILAGVPHEVVTGPDGAVVIEIFAPARADWKELERQEPRPPAWYA